MEHNIHCTFSDVSEHDMDLLFLEEFVCSTDFTRIFTDKVGVENPIVVSIHSSKTDVALGESDMTVIVESQGEKIGLLIEDKIDAIAMPEQAARYSLRGNKGIERGDFDRYFVFIIAPKKYLLQNAEAQKYPNHIEYERILSYFEMLNEPRAAFKIQQIKQAIEKQKKGYQIEMDPAVTDFWCRYSEFQKANYPDEIFAYNGESKGANASWPRFRTIIEGLYMYHKTEFGFVDLTFEGCAEKIVDIERLLTDTVGDYLKNGYSVHRTGKSAAVRIMVPVLDLHKTFESQLDSIKMGFDAIQKMSDAAKLFPYSAIVELLRKSNGNSQ